MSETSSHDYLEEESQDEPGVPLDENTILRRENLLDSLEVLNKEGRLKPATVDPIKFLKTVEDEVGDWPVSEYFSMRNSWDKREDYPDNPDLNFIDRIIDTLRQSGQRMACELLKRQIIFRVDNLTQNEIDKPELIDGKKMNGTRSSYPIKITEDDFGFAERILGDFLAQIYADYKSAEKPQQYEGRTPVLVCGIRESGEEEKEKKIGSFVPKEYFWKKFGLNPEAVFDNVTVVPVPKISEVPKDWEGRPLLYKNNKDYLSLLLVANKVLFDMAKFQKGLEKTKKERKEEIRAIRPGEPLPKVEYRVVDREKAGGLAQEVSRQVEHWHDFQPDYVFLTETSAFPIGYMFKEAWKAAYPDERPPQFFRVDPIAMGRNSNALELPGYEEKLEEFLNKRIKKPNARVAIFDEQPMTGKSQATVRKQIARKVPGASFDINKRDPSAHSIFEDVFGSNTGHKLTDKGQHVPPIDFLGDFLGGKVVYKSAEEIKFIGKRGRANLNLIYDLKTIGRLAGRTIKPGRK